MDYYTLHQTITFGSGLIVFALGALLFLIRIPRNETWQSFASMRNCLALSFTLLGIASSFSSSFIDGGDAKQLLPLDSAITIFVASLQALLYTITNLVFIRSSYVNKHIIILNIGLILLVALVLFLTLALLPQFFMVMFYLSIIAYCFQMYYYLQVFRREYAVCLAKLEEYYDEEEDSRLRWIRHCFYGALGIGIFAMAVSLPIPIVYMNIFIVIYTIYYIYIVSCVYNYLTDSAFIIPAGMKEEVDTFKKEEEDILPVDSGSKPEIECKKNIALETALEKWVESKMYTQKDISINNIASDLNVTQRYLSLYFKRCKGQTFRDWRMGLRVTEAKRILKDDPTITTSNICELIGIGDRSNFFRQFSTITNMTPDEYRQKFH